MKSHIQPREGMVSTVLNQVASADVRHRLHELFEGHRLSPAQRRIARYLLDHPDEAVFMTGSDLADSAGVSQPSVTRFSVALGFDGYPALRRELRDRVLVRSRPALPEDRESDVFARAVAQDIRRLEALAVSIHDGEQVSRVATALAKSRPLVVLGVRVSRPLADLFCYFARKVHPDVRLATDGSVASDQLMQAHNAGGSWVLVFGLPRYPAELVDHLRYAHELGLRVALITDQRINPLAGDADELLTAAVGTELVFDSPIAPVSLAMCLLQAMYDLLPAGEQARLEEFDHASADRELFTEE